MKSTKRLAKGTSAATLEAANDTEMTPKLPETIKELEEAVAEGETPTAPYKIYVTYDWVINKGNKRGRQAAFVPTHIPAVTTQEHIVAIMQVLAKQYGYDEVILDPVFLPLEG